jgi:DNA polymerase-3 subunit beta
MKIVIPVQPFYAMHALAAKEDVRYYLVGILIEKRNDGLFLVATDGNILGAYKVDGWSGDIENGTQLIVPLSLVKRCKPGKKDKMISIEYTEESKLITAKIGTQPIIERAIEGRFPQWNRVIPTTCSGEPGQFNPDILGRFSDFGAAMGMPPGARTPIISHSGEHGALVHMQIEQFVGVIMPIRMKNIRPPMTKAPAWAYGEVKPSAAAAKFVDELNDAITAKQAAGA